MRAELLSAQPDKTVEFLIRSAALDTMSGALCDAALITTGSAERLEALAQSNLLVIPLDEHRHWYRYHHIFRGLLRAELALREPELVPEIHRRAGEWCQVSGLPDVASATRWSRAMPTVPRRSSNSAPCPCTASDEL